MAKKTKPAVYIVYNKRGATSAKALRRHLENVMPDYHIRRSRYGNCQMEPDMIIRWGEAKFDFDLPTLNSPKAVTNAANKLRMINLLDECEEVTIPTLVAPDNYIEVVDEDGYAFFRNKHNQIRRRKSPVDGDKYALSPIDKTNEYRVHVFGDKIVGVYEKIPYDPDTHIYKNETCQFKRLDQANPELMDPLKGIRPMCKAATKKLGLLFSGVDVIRDRQGNIFILEVNSAPSLNEPNIKRWGKLFKEQIEQTLC